MTAISLNLPDDLAKHSKQLARKLGISRTELIRRALEHEISHVAAKIEREAMAQAFEAMKNDPGYLSASEALDREFNTTLPTEVDRWWEQ